MRTGRHRGEIVTHYSHSCQLGHCPKSWRRWPRLSSRHTIAIEPLPPVSCYLLETHFEAQATAAAFSRSELSLKTCAGSHSSSTAGGCMSGTVIERRGRTYQSLQIPHSPTRGATMKARCSDTSRLCTKSALACRTAMSPLMGVFEDNPATLVH